MNELQQLTGSDKPWASERANYALQIAVAVQQGQVSKDEAKSLLEDVIRTDALLSEADDDHTKAMLVYGVSQLIGMLV